MLGAMDIRGPLLNSVWLERLFIQALQDNDLQEVERCLKRNPALAHHAYIKDFLRDHKPSAAFISLVKQYEDIDQADQDQAHKKQKARADIAALQKKHKKK